MRISNDDDDDYDDDDYVYRSIRIDCHCLRIGYDDFSFSIHNESCKT